MEFWLNLIDCVLKIIFGWSQTFRQPDIIILIFMVHAETGTFIKLSRLLFGYLRLG